MLVRCTFVSCAQMVVSGRILPCSRPCPFLKRAGECVGYKGPRARLVPERVEAGGSGSVNSRWDIWVGAMRRGRPSQGSRGLEPLPLSSE